MQIFEGWILLFEPSVLYWWPINLQKMNRIGEDTLGFSPCKIFVLMCLLYEIPWIIKWIRTHLSEIFLSRTCDLLFIQKNLAIIHQTYLGYKTFHKSILFLPHIKITLSYPICLFCIRPQSNYQDWIHHNIILVFSLIKHYSCHTMIWIDSVMKISYHLKSVLS